MNNDIRNLSKWLNEEQETPIDRQALARILAMAQQPAPAQQCMEHGECFGGECIYPDTQPAQQQEPVAHCEAGPEHCPVCLAETRSLALAAAVGYVQRNTPQLVSEEICRALKKASQPAQRKPLTDEQIDRIAGHLGSVYPHGFARAIEAAHEIKEQP